MTIAFLPIKDCTDTQPFAQCRGVDLSRNLTSEEISTIKVGLLEYGLLLFRNQRNLTPENEVNFNRSFGWHDPGQTEFRFGPDAPASEHHASGGAQIPDWPQVSVLGTVYPGQYRGIRNTQLVPRPGFTCTGWHADGLHDLFDGMPELTTMYNPFGYASRAGGNACFTSGVRAMERMSPLVARELEQCIVAYMRCPNDDKPDESRRVAPGLPYMVDEGTRRIGFAVNMKKQDARLHDFELRIDHADDGGRHRCVHIHPATGQKSFYATPGHAVYLLDERTGEIRYDIQETVELLSMALLPSVEPGVRYEHIWQEGDFIAWINTLVLHCASDALDIEGNRLLHRVRLSTPKKRWVDGKYIHG